MSKELWRYPLILLGFVLTAPAHADVDLAGMAEEFDLFGHALAVGDFNGDDFDDLAVGTPLEDDGSISNAGAVNIIYGSSLGLWTLNNVVITQNALGNVMSETGDQFGYSLAAGDFDNDGYDDLAVGVPFEDIENKGTINSGGVVILRGSSSGITTAGAKFRHQNSSGIKNAAQSGDRFGFSLAVGHFNKNNDDFVDLAIGVPGEDINGILNAGAVQVLYGSASGISSRDDFFHQDYSDANGEIEGVAEVGDQFGWSLAVGNFKKFAHDDYLVVGVPREDIGDIVDAGAVNIIYSDGNGLSTAINSILYQGLWYQGRRIPGIPHAGDHFGHAVTTGSFTHNFFGNDVAVGVPYEDVNGIVDAGAVNIIDFNSNNHQLWTQENIIGDGDGPEPGDMFGSSLAADNIVQGPFGVHAGDELAIGIPGESIGSVPKAGAVQILYASEDGLVSRNHELFNTHFWHQNTAINGTAEPKDRFGTAVLFGNFKNKNANDLVISTKYEHIGDIDDAGVVQVLYNKATDYGGYGLYGSLNADGNQQFRQ